MQRRARGRTVLDMTALDEEAAPVADALPEQIARDFNVTAFLKQEVDKSGELYLKVALWKVLLRLPQHLADSAPARPAPEARDYLRRMLVSLMAQSEELIAEGVAQGGLDEVKHGVSEPVVRENIQWLREKLVLLELELTEARKNAILSAFQ